MGRGLLVPVLVGLAFLLCAAPAVAAPPPTLTGESFYADSVLVYGPGPQPLACRDNPDGTAEVDFNLSGSGIAADGPYEGPWTHSGTVKLGAPTSFGDRAVQSLTGEFTIDAPTGQVSGTTQLAPSAQNGGSADCDTLLIGYIQAALRYSARITTAGGVFTDRGATNFSLNQHNARQPIWDYDQAFTSDLTTTEQNESALFGQRVPGGSFSAMSANSKRASAFTLYYPATVRKLYAYVDGMGATSGSQTIRGVLYRHGPGGAPGALVAPTFQFTVPARMSPRWVPLWLAPPARLTPGVYWIGLQSNAANGVARFAWSSKPNSRRFNLDVYGDGADNPFGSAALDDKQMSIFAAGNY